MTAKNHRVVVSITVDVSNPSPINNMTDVEAEIVAKQEITNAILAAKQVKLWGSEDFTISDIVATTSSTLDSWD